MITVRLFARLREELGVAELQLPAVSSVAAMIDVLEREQGPVWGAALSEPGIIIAVNQRVADRDAALADGDELAFLPPVTGG